MTRPYVSLFLLCFFAMIVSGYEVGLIRLLSRVTVRDIIAVQSADDLWEAAQTDDFSDLNALIETEGFNLLQLSVLDIRFSEVYGGDASHIQPPSD